MFYADRLFFSLTLSFDMILAITRCPVSNLLLRPYIPNRPDVLRPALEPPLIKISTSNF